MSRIDADLHKVLKKACSIEETAPKRKHVRACIVYTWDHQSAKAVFDALKSQPFVNDEVQLFKSLIVLHKVIQEGHPSALKQAIREREWIRSLGRVHGGGSEYGKLIREYVRYLIIKLDFHAHHKGFHNGTFEYEEYVSLVAVADPDEGYETILDLMSLQDSLDEFSQLIFASIQAASRNPECKIASLIPMIAESYGIYKFITSMLRAMHRQLNDQEGDEALLPLKERYEIQHARLFEFYADCSSIKFLTSLVTIPKLPTDAPNIFVANDGDSVQGKEIKFERKKNDKPLSPVNVPDSQPPSRAPSSLITPMSTAGAAALVPTVTAAAAMVPTMTPAQIQPDFWAQQQSQYINEQARLEQERQNQLQQQQAQQQVFQQQLQSAQQEMMQMQLQQQSQNQSDLMALTNQYEKDQALLEQYDQRVQQLENEINTMNQNASQQLSNKDEQISSLQEQLQVWEKKYESLAKLYSQLRQEHLQLLPRFKKLQVKVSSAKEAIAQKEQFENKMKHKDMQMAELIRDRDRLRVENDRMNVKINELPSEEDNSKHLEVIKENKMIPIIDACLESGINTIQESIFNLDAPVQFSGPLAPPTFLLSLVEGTSERATDFATSFNDLIVDGIINGDQTTVILNISEFSTAVASLLTNCKTYSANAVDDEKCEELLDVVKRCGREAQYFFEDLMSENLSPMDDEAKTDVVINANVDMQEKLQGLSLLIEPLLNTMPSKGHPTNAHSELVATAENIVRSSQKLRVNVDVNVPKPLLDLALGIVDSIVALVRAAIECQNEIASASTTPLDQFYKKNSRWTEGLISAAKAVGSATNILISTAGSLISNDTMTSPEEFIVASKEVAGSTAQLVAASRVKTSSHSRAQNKLEVCSKDVSDACKALVNNVMTSITTEVDEKPLEFSSDHAVKTAEMEQQVTVLKLEQSLANARKRLGEIRKHSYYLNEEDEN